MNIAPLIKNLEHLKAHPDKDAAHTAGVIAEWVKVMDSKMLDNEMEIGALSERLAYYDDRTEMFLKLLVITGNGHIISTMQVIDTDKFKRAIDFLFQAKDRVNHRNIYPVATLLDLAMNEGRNITTLQELVNYANGK